MPREIQLRLSPKQASDDKTYVPIAARMAGVDISRIALARVVKRSIDARGSVKVNLTVELFIDQEAVPAPLNFDYPYVGTAPEVVVVGSGPAGLFCALGLIEAGLKPVVLERGKDVTSRKRDIASINRGKCVDPDSNYCFGEGGAGTFSDGKLFTRSKKRGDHHRALQTLVFHGADPDILCDWHPHIGSDKLPGIISRIRRTILDSGGEVRFGSRVTGIVLRNGRATGVTAGGNAIEGQAVVLATGHSARDVYRFLHCRGILLEAKPFAVGMRVEHPQSLIDSIQYHMPERGDHLPAASYSLTTQVAGRGVYSFCMCPGGFIVPSMTSDMECVVNGMSASGRNSRFANSAIVTEVKISDLTAYEAEHGVLAGIEFQESLEHAARKYGGERHKAPAQRLTDFLVRRVSSSLEPSSYIPGLTAADHNQWLPGFLSAPIREGLRTFGNKMRGFVTDQAMLIGLESRTSTPVRIPRDPYTLQHPVVNGLYPAGEGAGYAGGILSAAIDGQRIAEAVARNIRRPAVK